MNNNHLSFSTEQQVYPTVFKFFHLQDCMPNNPKALYTIIDHSDDDDFDEDDDAELEFHIPTRPALYQLIKDINTAINEEIQGYLYLGHGPGDDATSDISNAIDCLKELISWDEL